MSYTLPPVPTTTVQYTPVTFETPFSLTGCTLTDGRGLLVWCNGLNVRFAITTTPASWLADSVVTAASTAVTVTDHLSSASCFMAGGYPHIVVSWVTPTVGYVRVYKGNDGANPTSWSLHGTVQSYADNRSDGAHPTYEEGQRVAGIPYINGSTWTLGTAVWGGGGAVNTYWTHGAVCQSTDAGASWSTKINLTYGTAGRFTDFISPHVGLDPASGYLYWMAGSTTSGSGTNTSQWCKSIDGGTTWGVDQDVGPGNYLAPYTGYRGYLYGLDSGTATHKLNDPDGNFFARTSISSHLSVPLNAHLCNGAETLYLFSNTTVQWALPPAVVMRPVVGFVGWR